MAYTVKKLAKLSKVTVRTLHHYDAIGLLKPAYTGANGYRIYEEKQLLLLQQILFFRELGFELKKIQKILGRSDFDQVSALHSHRAILEKEAKRMRGLIETIDKTIDHLQGKKPMKDSEMYMGFSEEKQAEYEKYLVNRLGEKVKNYIDESKKTMKKWSKTEWEKFSHEWDAICKDMAHLLDKKRKADSEEVQKVIQRHFDWLPWSKHSICNKESYTGLGAGYTGFEWKSAFEKYDSEHPRLALYLAEGMRIFAEKHLS